MDWIFDNDKPIYLQLIEQLKIAIVSGIYKPGEKLPPVRELALETKVNPNTMQKALSELEEYGIVYTQRTSGRFVTQDEKLLKKIKLEVSKEKIEIFLNSMYSLGFSDEEIIQSIKDYGKGV